MQPIPAPPARPDRPGLLERLNAGLSQRLLLLLGPAEAERTGLLRRWARGCGRPTGWVALQPADNDPQRFLAGLGAALEGALPAKLPRAFDRPGILGSPAALNPADAMVELLNRLADLLEPAQAGAPDGLVIILDDYDVIEAAAVHGLVQTMLDYLPSRAHLVIAASNLPALEFERWRVRRQMAEIVWSPSPDGDNEAG
jgi:LuxR family maltose regulon positive regulatory protein